MKNEKQKLPYCQKINIPISHLHDSCTGFEQTLQ